MKKTILAAIFAATGLQASAGGLLTNTNQSISFLRNPSRDAAIGIDGVYSNPAGVAFLNDGFHIGVNWQAAWQKRQIETTNQLFAYNLNDNATTKHFEGTASAPFIPSIQAAYNTGKWSFQFNFAVHGGGGKCTFDDGIGTFDEALGKIAYAVGSKGYRANSFMQGNQYYFGFTLGAAYQINQHLSVYGGLRALYGSASYKADISDIMVKTEVAPGTDMAIPFSQFLQAGIGKASAGIEQLNTAIATMEAAHLDASAYKAQLAEVQAQLGQLQALNKYNEGVNLQSDQSGFGIAPIIGIDYKIGDFNFAGKYEFRTRMSLKNKSTLDNAGVLDAMTKFEDGTSIREDNPAALALGAQWSALKNLRVSAGYHHFYDCEAKRYNNDQELLDHGTNEYLGGVEWDPIDRLTISGGVQFTNYGLTDKFMNDMSFNVSSWSFGVGAAYQLTDNVKLEVGYLQTNYEDYKTSTPNANGSMNTFTRKSNCLGAGVVLDF